MVAVQELEEICLPDDIIVNGSTWAAIWHMSWPSLVQMFTIALASFADVWVAGQLGSDVQAAIGIGGQVWYLMILLAVAICAGVTALVSRYWGAKDLEGAIEAARQSIMFGFFFGIGSALLGLLCVKPFFHLLGASPAVEQLGWDYLKIDIWSQIPFTLLWIVNSINRARGNARIPMMIWAFMTAMTITLDFVFCLGPWRLGVGGIGWSWLVSSIIGTSLSLYLLAKSPMGECLNLQKILHTGLNKQWIVRLLKIGLPTCIQDISWVGGNFFLLIILARTAYPTAAQASWAVGLRLEEMISSMPIHALGMAVSTIVGQNLGARLPERAELVGWQVAALGCGFNLVVGIIMFVFAQPIASMMSTDPQVIHFTAQFLQILGLCEPFVAAWLTLFNAMQGAGYTKWPMIASCICLTVVRLPLAWFLTVQLNWGPAGAWLAISFSAVIIGIIAIWRFRTGVWKTQKV